MITPVLHRVLIKLDSVEKTTASGIVIPESVTEKERKAVELGTVIALGKTAFKDFGDVTTVVVGSRVVIARYSGKEVQEGDDKYIVINDEDILCTVKDEE